MRGPDKEAFQKCVNLNLNLNKNKNDLGEAKGDAERWREPLDQEQGERNVTSPPPDGCA